MRYHIKLRHIDGIEQLRRKVRVWEDLGVAGVTVSDHLYTSRAIDTKQLRHDPYVLLAAVGALSDRLDLSVLVANSGHGHPYLALRHFAELALLYGGERVYAGFGAGWNGEEFDALGLEMPPHTERLIRLTETAALARALFDAGTADVAGRAVTVRQIPLSPTPGVPPRLAIGGGSRAVAKIAAAYADHFDFDAPAHRLPLTRSTNGAATRARDIHRRMITTFDDLLYLRGILHTERVNCGRTPAAVTTSINVSAVRIGANASSRWLDDLSRTYSVTFDARHSRSVGRDNPFFLLGSTEALAEVLAGRHAAELGLTFVVLPDCADTERLLRFISGDTSG